MKKPLKIMSNTGRNQRMAISAWLDDFHRGDLPAA
jgi:hypothetical protein